MQKRATTRALFNFSNSFFQQPQLRTMALSETKKKELEQLKLHPSMQPVNMQPIGYIESCYSEKNGCPRQPLLANQSKSMLRISQTVLPNPSSSVEGLQGFSHVWILFLFHFNSKLKLHQKQMREEKKETTTTITSAPQQQQQQQHVDTLFDTKTKTKPPRMSGDSVGVFACRAPYRPNPIGLSVAKLDKIEHSKGDCILYFSGLDLVNETPVLDIKPYIPTYDSLPNATLAPWFANMPEDQQPIKTIHWTEQAMHELQTLIPKCKFYHSLNEIVPAIEQSLSFDPRSAHMKRKKKPELFGLWFDNVNVLCKFIFKPETKEIEAEIVKVEDWSAGKPDDVQLQEKDDSYYFSTEYEMERKLFKKDA